ncbi:MAG: YbhN family protein [Acidimicrobiia bacterium]|nr:YbhN family protein [Acidimicrobiia bacterium]
MTDLPDHDELAAREPAVDDPPDEHAVAESDASDEVPGGGRQVWWKQAISIAVTVAVLVAVFGFVIPQVADYREIIDTVADISPTSWVVLGILALWFLIAYPIVLTTVLRTLRLQEAFVNHTTGTAVTNSLPGGGAIAVGLNYAMYMSWGFTPPSITAGLLAAGVWDWYARIAIPVVTVALIAVAGEGETAGWMWAVSIGGTIWVAFSVWLVYMVLRSDSFAHAVATWLQSAATKVAGWFHRDPPQTYESVLRFRIDMRSVVSTRAWPLTAATVGNHLAMASLYTASIYAVGISTDEIPIPWVVASFALGRFLVMIPVSPGGLGLVDLGWIGLLTLGWQTTNPGEPVPTDLIAAGVLLFRGLSLLPPIPIGMGTWIFWRTNRSWRKPWRTAMRGDTTVAD